MANVSIEKGAPAEDEIQLYDPVFEGYEYGPGGRGETICFGTRGGFEPRVWIGPRVHPLLDGLLRERPDIIEGDGDTGRIRVFVCPECGFESKSLFGLKSHQRAHKATVVLGEG